MLNRYMHLSVSFFIFKLSQCKYCIHVFHRKEFFHHRLEVIDMCIIIISFILTIVIEIEVQHTEGKLGKYVITDFVDDTAFCFYRKAIVTRRRYKTSGRLLEERR